MRTTSSGKRDLARFGTLPALALIAAIAAPSARAQIRARPPVLTSPEQQRQTIRQRVPAPDTNCPDPAQARRDGRRVPSGCPQGQDEQAPVAVQYREQTGETQDSGGREARPVAGRRRSPTADTPLVDQPIDDGRLRQRRDIRPARTPADDETQDAVPDRSAPVRRRNDYVLRTPGEVAPRDTTPVRQTPDRRRDGYVAGTPDELAPRDTTPVRTTPVRRRGDYVAQTPDEVAPRREITPDRPPPIRRRADDVAQTPDEIPTEITPIRPNPIRRRDDYVATPNEQAGQRRVPLPRRSEEPAPARPVRPVGDGNFPVNPAGGIGGQVQCIVPRPFSKTTFYDFDVKMLCGFPGPAKPMTFNFGGVEWGAVQRAYVAGDAALVTFGKPVNGVYPVIAVGDGMPSRGTMVCVPIHAGFHSTLTVSSHAVITSDRLWCTVDGKVVNPVDMGWMEGSMKLELWMAEIEKGPIEVGYFHLTAPYTLDTVRQLTRYPELGTIYGDTTAISNHDKVWDQTQYPGGHRLTYAEPPLTGPVIQCSNEANEIAGGNCIGNLVVPGANPNQGSESFTVRFRAFASDVVINAASRQPAYDEYKTVIYTLMPGIIPVQYRAEAGGACRVIIGVQVEIKPIPQAQGVGRAKEDNAGLMAGGEMGTSSGVASGNGPYVPDVRADDCK